MSLPPELQRYARQIVLPTLGVEGQKRIFESSVLIVGAGGLGSPVSLYLAAAGVGRIGLVDDERVELSNLHRQILFEESSVGRAKAEAAAERLRLLNSSVRIVVHHERLTSANALDIIAKYDVVVDGSDNFPTRYLINDAAVLLRKPNVYGSIFRLEGQASLFVPHETPCYRCLYPEPPAPGVVPDCEEGGVLGSIAGLVGSIQATETLKLIAGIDGSLRAKLLLIDARRMDFRSIAITRDPECAVCGESPTITQLFDEPNFCGVNPMPQNVENITPKDLAEKLAKGEHPVIVDVREQQEWDLGHMKEAELLPLSKWPAIAEKLDPDQEIVVVCRSGGRSMRAAQALVASGFRSVKNLEGGMMRWSQEIDPGISVR